MRRILSLLALMTLGLAGTSLASMPAEPVGPSTPAAAVLPGGTPAPVFLMQFPGCGRGYFITNQECQTCGTIQPTGSRPCTTCTNISTEDEYTTCGGCDFFNECIVP
jgi:hypothetical protein